LFFWPSGLVLLALWHASFLASWSSGMPRFWPLGLLACLASGLCAFWHASRLAFVPSGMPRCWPSGLLAYWPFSGLLRVFFGLASGLLWASFGPSSGLHRVFLGLASGLLWTALFLQSLGLAALWPSSGSWVPP
jgi:hypothetical protein